MYVGLVTFLILLKLTLTIGGHQNPDTAKFLCTSTTHMTPNRGYAILQTRDAGDPQMLMLNRTGTSVLPSEILVKKIGSGAHEWVRFDPTKAVKTITGNLVMRPANPAPSSAWYSERFFPEVMRSEKSYAVEFAKALSSR
jgi:hypothetical protein